LVLRAVSSFLLESIIRLFNHHNLFLLSESVQSQLEKTYNESISLEDALKIGMLLVSRKRAPLEESSRDTGESFADVCVLSRIRKDDAPRYDVFLKQKSCDFVLETLNKRQL
jgi:hypothetical protein